jgi:hypothetical protein
MRFSCTGAKSGPLTINLRLFDLRTLGARVAWAVAVVAVESAGSNCIGVKFSKAWERGGMSFFGGGTGSGEGASSGGGGVGFVGSEGGSERFVAGGTGVVESATGAAIVDESFSPLFAFFIRDFRFSNRAKWINL